ncbi:MAG: AMP-binding protein [Spirochaetes bacterium]|jgi:long-chain acyl-CoA synthetase|nr:AMP-binding protein [Spirochaetota bacterium]
MQRTVLAMLEQAAEDFPETPYVWQKIDDGWSSMTFREVRDATRALATGLLSIGIGRDDKVTILAEGRQEWVIGELAVLHAGGVSVPLSIKLLPDEIPFRVNHSESKLVILSTNTASRITEVFGDFENEVMVLCLDDDSDTLGRIEEATGLKRGEWLFSYPELLERGRRELGVRETELSALAKEISEEDVVTISYTSGTTGNPKGIMLTHKNYYVNVHDSVNLHQVPHGGYSTLLILPCDHSFAHTVGLYAALPRGIQIYFVDARGGGMATIRNIPTNLKETEPVFLLTVPALTGNFMKKIKEGIAAQGGVAKKLFDAGLAAGIAYYGDVHNKPPFFTRLKNYLPYKLADAVVFSKVRQTFGRNIQFCVGGGALLDRKQQEFFKAIGVPVYQGYGLTEAAPVISSNTPYAHKIGSSGRVAASVDCRILAEDGSECAVGEVGQIAIRGENVMKGYFKNESATAETLRDGMLLTGDRGYFDEDHYLYVVGREKALLISPDGEKYSPEEIEEAIVNGSELVHQALVYNDHNRYTGALITLDDEKVRARIAERGIADADALLDELRADLYRFEEDPAYRRKFPSQWIPSTFQVLEEQFTEENKMINSSMKMVRFKVVEAHTDRIDAMYAEDGQDHRNERNRQAVRSLFSL